MQVLRLFLLVMALLVVGCGSTPNPPVPVPDSPVQFQVETPVSPPVSESIVFANRLRFPPNDSWTVDPADASDTKMSLVLSQGGTCGLGECPVLTLFTEEISTWNWQFKDGIFVSYGPCNNGHTMYDTPVRDTGADILVDGKVGMYYQSLPCAGTPGGHRRTWLFQYGGGSDRWVMVEGRTTTTNGSAKFSDQAVREYLQSGEWNSF